jgi:hypothetical protein
MRIKPPGLFYVGLALFLACLLFISYPIPVYSVPLVAIAILVAIAGGFFLGWFVHQNLASRPESPGVDIRSYVLTLFDGWRILFKNVLHTVDWASQMMGRYDLYYIRRAEYRALDYLDQSNLPETVMVDVAKELCAIQKNMVQNIKQALVELDNINDAYLTGSANNYRFALGYGPVSYYDLKSHELDDIHVEAYGTPAILWDCNIIQPATVPSRDEWYDLEEYLLIGGSISDAGLRLYNNYIRVAYACSYNCSYVGAIIDQVYFTQGKEPILKQVLLTIIARWAEIYNQAKSFAQAYHSTLRNLGFTSKSSVPTNYICPPPDIAFYDANELATQGMSLKDISIVYMTYLQAVGEQLDKQVGCFQGGLVTATYTTYVTTYTTVTGGTTQTGTTTITTVINGTTTTYTTTYTTVINGTTTTITTTTSGGVYITPQGIYVPDPFTRLQNVTITLPDGVQFMVAELTLLDTTQDVSFTAGQCTTLTSGMTVMMAFYNGTVRTTLLPSGTAICPQKILTPKGEVASYTYKEKPLAEWYQQYWNPPQPKWLETADKMVTLLISMMVVLVPLMILAMVMNMIGSMIRGRAVDIRGARHARAKAYSETLQA